MAEQELRSASNQVIVLLRYALKKLKEESSSQFVKENVQIKNYSGHQSVK